MSDKKKKKGSNKKVWKEPEDKSEWLNELVEAGESAVKAYEEYLLNKINHVELARVMTILHDLLPMSIYKNYEECEEEE